ncbi:hypothetical protein D364_01385 [Klebsiella pneumoniae CG43]|nr:hypothetical protein D364_01385 [Klebsiella pneumoniae CG43]
MEQIVITIMTRMQIAYMIFFVIEPCLPFNDRT